MVHSCPICKAALTDKVYDGVKFLECSQCAGIWIFEEDLKQLESENVQDLDQLDLADVPMKPAESPTDVLTCPECSGAMEQFHFMIDTPIMLHRCDTCEGLWIDDGELTQMASAIEAAHRPPTAEEISTVGDAHHLARMADIAADVAPGATPRTESDVELRFDQEHAETMARYNAITALCLRFSTRIQYNRLWPTPPSG